MIAALFGDEAVQKSRNTEAIEIGNGTLVSARVKAFEPARRLPLEEVRERIVELVRIEQGRVKRCQRGRGDAGRAAQGRAVRCQLERGAQAAARCARSAGGGDAGGVLGLGRCACPRTSASSPPMATTCCIASKRCERAQIGDKDPRVAAVAGQYNQLLAGRDFSAFLSELRQRYEVTINPTALQVEQR